MSESLCESMRLLVGERNGLAYDSLPLLSYSGCVGMCVHAYNLHSKKGKILSEISYIH